MMCRPILNDALRPKLSRRQLVQTLAGALVVHSCGAAGQRVPRGKARYAYVGTYTGGAGNGEGIYRFEMDPYTGLLSGRELAAASDSPSWLTVDSSERYLYAANEISSFHGTSGAVSAFAIEGRTGALHALGSVSSEGAGPAYIGLDRSGRHLLVANYIAGTIAVLPVTKDGSLGSATDVHRDVGPIGSTHASSGPPGSFAVSGHDAPHAHMILADPSNRFVLSTDLGQDRIYIWRFDAEAGKLTPNPGAPFVTLPSGDGPRHLAFHPNGRWLYSIQEEASTLAFFVYDAARGQLAQRQTVSTLPDGFAGTSFASEVAISHDGRFLYAGNRLHDTIGIFSIKTDGALMHIGECSTLGDYAAQFQLDPSGEFLFACDHRSDCVTTFRVNRRSGMLTPTGAYTAVGSPGSIVFLG